MKRSEDKDHTREDAVLSMQLMLIPILMKAWSIDLQKLSELFKEYDVPGYIDVCYEVYNSIGINGIIEDLKEFIEMQGGSITVSSENTGDPLNR